jgi:tetratricopeptide (TPR) repeat protein
MIPFLWKYNKGDSAQSVIMPQNYSDKIIDVNPSRQSMNQNFNGKMDSATEKRYLEGIYAYLTRNYNKAVNIWEEILVEQPYNKKVFIAIRGAREKMKQNSNIKDIEMDMATQQRYLEGIDAYLEGNYNRALTIWQVVLLEQPNSKKVLSAMQGARERMERL